MKLQFKKQTYQAVSVEAVVDCFPGQPKSTGVKYRVDPGRAKDPQQSLPGFDEVRTGKNIGSQKYGRAKIGEQNIASLLYRVRWRSH